MFDDPIDPTSLRKGIFYLSDLEVANAWNLCFPVLLLIANTAYAHGVG